MNRSLAQDLLLFFVFGMALRVWAVLQAHDVGLYLDEVDYYRRASFILENGHLPDAFRPPVYPLFIAMVRVFADSVDAVRLAQAGLGALTACVLVAWLTPTLGTRAARLGGALACLYPAWVGFPHLLLSETLFLTLFALALAAAWAPGEHRSRQAALAGFTFGLAWLTRSALGPCLPVVLLGSLVRVQEWHWRTRPWFRAALFVLGVAVVVTPWAAHNRVVQGRWILVEMTSGYNLWKGNTSVEHAYRTEGPKLPGPLWSIPMFAYEGSADQLNTLCADRLGVPADAMSFEQVSDCAGELAREHILADPIGFLDRGLDKLALSFHPSNELTRYLWLGWYGNVSPSRGLALHYGSAVAYGILLVLAAVGLVRSRWTPLEAGLVALVLVQMAVIFVSFGNVRFRMPIELILMVLAALAVRPRPLPGSPRGAAVQRGREPLSR